VDDSLLLVGATFVENWCCTSSRELGKLLRRLIAGWFHDWFDSCGIWLNSVTGKPVGVLRDRLLSV
jgi:hypothetical protein